MPRLFEHRHYRTLWAGAIEFDGRNDALADPVIEVLEKHEGAALPSDRKRIGIEAMSGISDDRPWRAGQIAGCPDAGVIGVAPADMPVRRVTAKPINSPGNLAGDAAENVRARRTPRLDLAVLCVRHRVSGLARENSAQQCHGAGHDGVERAAQAVRGLGR